MAAALTTAVLSLDATVVLLTPIVLVTAARTGVRPRPHVYAAAHLANSASLLLPVSNLTNLLAFAAGGFSFVGFTALLPAVESSPGLTYAGSLATLLRRQILHVRGAAPEAGDFLRLGLLTVPVALVTGVLALWLGLRLAG